MWSLFKTPNNTSFYTIVKWYTWPGLQVCFGAQDLSPPYLIAPHFIFYAFVSWRWDSVFTASSHVQGLKPKTSHKPISHGLSAVTDRLRLCLSLCVNAICSKFMLLITYFRAVYVGHVALWHSPIKKGVTSSPLLNVTFVKGIMGHFI